MFKFSIGRRGLAAFAAALALSPLAGGCALAKPAAACTPQPTLRQEPLEIVTAQGVAKFTVELADTPGRQETGMMCRTSLAPDRGMLFDFKTPREVAFWMHNTLIPLDMVFIDARGRVFSIARNATPQTDTPRPSGGPVRAVLELAGGRAAQLGVLPGDRVRHRIFPK